MGKRLDDSKIIDLDVQIDLIDPHPDNYNQHPEEQIKQLANSHHEFGQYRRTLLWAQPNGRYVQVTGHGFKQGAMRDGRTSLRAEVLPQDTDPLVVKAIIAADNLHAQNSNPDETMLAQLLQEQADAGYELASLGTDEKTLQQMLKDVQERQPPGEEDEGEEVEVEPGRVRAGDVWQCGGHRIACLDAFDSTTYEVLLQDVRPTAIIADPPYGMRLDTDFSQIHHQEDFGKRKGIKGGHKYAEVIGDHEDFDVYPILSRFRSIKEQFWFGADYYSASLEDTMHTGCWLVWDKRVDESTDKMFGSCFELIWSRQKHKRDMLRHKWAGVFGTEHEPQRGRQHPTQKPVRLLEDIITRYTSEGQIILDPFLGSGTTLIAAQRVGNRQVYGCEISPAYCDVILSRFEAESGEKAQCIKQGVAL